MKLKQSFFLQYLGDNPKMRILDFLMDNLGIKYKIQETEHDSFIKGRVGRVIVKDKPVAYIGEIHPKVLQNWNIQMPIAIFELNLTDLLDLKT